MNRRNFFKNGSLATLGAAFIHPFSASAKPLYKNKKAKNIIIVVSDGMSTGTLNMADLYLSRITGKSSNWLQLYQENQVQRALMDMASASSIVTDSAAASSSWGGGARVPNGRLNVSSNGAFNMPIWQKFKKAGKKAGCVTTVPITHATPAGFCINAKSRNDQEQIAALYLEQKFDVLMGGGSKYFSPTSRKDKVNMYANYSSQGYTVVKTRKDLLDASLDKPMLGVFAEDGLPYTIDRNNSEDLLELTPTLAEMTQVAIDAMKDNPEGFVLQVEAGKVDWAAHANDIGGLIYDQVAHDEAVQVAINFAKENTDTLVIITTDHGNANPGVIYGHKANDNFDTIQQYKHTNEWVLNGITKDTSLSQIKERIHYANGIALKEEEANELLGYYKNLNVEEGLYNPRHLPFSALAEIQKKYNSVGWISMQHSADYVELAMYGPGSELLNPLIKNTDLHYLMLQAAEVENKW